MNVDGGLSKIGDRGASTVISRDRHGLFLGASAVIFEGLLDPTILEAQACNEALALAADLHTQSVCVASDCIEVVTNIHTAAPCRYFAVLEEIKHRRRSIQDVHFLHENRKHNEEARALAKAAASLPLGRHVWLTTLPDIICIPMCLNIPS